MCPGLELPGKFYDCIGRPYTNSNAEQYAILCSEFSNRIQASGFYISTYLLFMKGRAFNSLAWKMPDPGDAVIGNLLVALNLILFDK
jgi:hypothetical protein